MDPERLLPWYQLHYAMAHIEIWAHMVEKKLPFALVFEDDARVSVEPHQWVQYFEKVGEASTGWTFLLLLLVLPESCTQSL